MYFFFFVQEYLVVEVFERKLGLFLTLCQFFGYASYAFFQRCLRGDLQRAIPLRYYIFLSCLQASMQALTNVSMMYLNYPAKVLFKSSRVVPIMCFGVLWQGRKYSRRDYLVVVLIVVGLVTFLEADSKTSPSYSLIGVGLISLALVVDAILINIQEDIMNFYNCCQDELIMYSYIGGTIIMSLACLYTGDLGEGLQHMHERGCGSVLAIMLFAGAGFLGVSCVAALTKRFGALVSAITTTARKAVTLFLSFLFFPKPISLQHYVGAILFIFGLVIKATAKKRKSHDSSTHDTLIAQRSQDQVNGQQQQPCHARKHVSNSNSVERGGGLAIRGVPAHSASMGAIVARGARSERREGDLLLSMGAPKDAGIALLELGSIDAGASGGINQDGCGSLSSSSGGRVQSRDCGDCSTPSTHSPSPPAKMHSLVNTGGVGEPPRQGQGQRVGEISGAATARAVLGSDSAGGCPARHPSSRNGGVGDGGGRAVMPLSETGLGLSMPTISQIRRKTPGSPPLVRFGDLGTYMPTPPPSQL
ncbi:unnamed protein product [Choristocarpus tenellus]